MLRPEDYFALAGSAHAALFAGLDHVWGALPRLEAYVRARLTSDMPATTGHDALPGGVVVGPQVHIGAGVTIEPGVYVEGPALIGEGALLRHGAYVRAFSVVAPGALVGHASETKHSVLLERASVPHFAYVGDSLLGARVNLGAGTKLSNLAVNNHPDAATGQRPTIHLTLADGQVVDTGLAKFGAVLGDDVQLGCNCVTNPGTLIGPRTWVYALTSVPKGVLPADSVVKLRQALDVAPRRGEGPPPPG